MVELYRWCCVLVSCLVQRSETLCIRILYLCGQNNSNARKKGYNNQNQIGFGQGVDEDL